MAANTRVLSCLDNHLIANGLRFKAKLGVTLWSSKDSLSSVEMASFTRSNVVFHYIEDIRTSGKDYLNDHKMTF